MRARLVRPEFWHDAIMADLPLATRLTYIGLWCIADDAGYLDWNEREIGAELYPHMTVGKRNRQVAADLARLLAARRVVVLDCQHHAVIPTLETHRIAGGNRSERVKHAHDKESTYTAVRNITERTDKSRSESLSPSLSESESVSGRRGANGSSELEGRKRAPTVEERRAELERQLLVETKPEKRQVIETALARMTA